MVSEEYTVKPEILLTKSKDLDSILSQIDNMSEVLAKKYLEETVKSNLTYIKNMQMIDDYTKTFLTNSLCRSLSELENYFPKVSYKMRDFSIEITTKKIKMLSNFYKILYNLNLG